MAFVIYHDDYLLWLLSQFSSMMDLCQQTYCDFQIDINHTKIFQVNMLILEKKTSVSLHIHMNCHVEMKFQVYYNFPDISFWPHFQYSYDMSPFLALCIESLPLSFSFLHSASSIEFVLLFFSTLQSSVLNILLLLL